MKFAFLEEPPFNFRDATGAVSGCDVQLARHVYTQLGIAPFHPVETEFAHLLPGLARGDWRMTTGLFVTPERQAIAAFSRPIWALPDGLLVRQGNPLDLTGYRAIADRPGCTLAIIRDQVQHQTARALGVPDTRVLVFDTYQDAAQAVLTGKADAYASVARAHLGWMDRHPDAPASVIVVPVTEKAPATGAFAFALADQDLRAAVDSVLAAYLGTADHRRMMSSFGFGDADIDLLTDLTG